MKRLAEIKPWFLEEPTAPDEHVLPLYLSAAFVPFFLPTGHCTTCLTRSQQYPRSCLHSARTLTIGVATGEHAHNRMVSKQPLQAGAIDVVQIDSCRLAGVSEVLAVLLMAAKFGMPVCPHAGGVRLCEYAIHLR